MADELRMVADERGIAEHMIEMRVSIDDETDWRVGARLNLCAQGLPGGQTAAGVDDGDTILTHHEPYVGAIAARRVIDPDVSALVHEHARGDFLEIEIVRTRVAGMLITGNGEYAQQAGTQNASGKNPERTGIADQRCRVMRRLIEPLALARLQDYQAWCSTLADDVPVARASSRLRWRLLRISRPSLVCSRYRTDSGIKGTTFRVKKLG